MASTEKQKNAAKARYYQRKRLGLCMYCPEKALPGRIRCEIHTQITADYVAGRRDLRKLNGLCSTCGKVPVTKFANCPDCRKKRSAQYAEKKAAQNHQINDRILRKKRI